MVVASPGLRGEGAPEPDLVIRLIWSAKPQEGLHVAAPSGDLARIVDVDAGGTDFYKL